MLVLVPRIVFYKLGSLKAKDDSAKCHTLKRKNPRYLFTNPRTGFLSVPCGDMRIGGRLRQVVQRILAVVSVVRRVHAPAPPGRIQALQKALGAGRGVPRSRDVTENY